MKHKYYPAIVLGVVTILAAFSPVSALIKVEWTVEKLYKEEKTSVLLAKVVDVTMESHVINVAIKQKLKGTSPGPKIRVQVVSPVEILKDIAPEQPIVLFLGETEGAINIADTWLLLNAVPNSTRLVWRVIQVYDTVKQSFPGRTSALVRLVTDLASTGATTYLNKWEHKPFAGGMKKRAALAAKKPAWILAEDLNADKKPDLIIGTAAGTQILLATADGYADATAQWGALGNTGAYHASGDADGDGKPDLLLDGTLWLNQGQKLAASKAAFELPKGKPLAAALLDVNGDGKLDALFLSADGDLRVYENPGAPDKPWTARPAKSLWTAGEAPAYASFGDWGDTGKPHAMVITKSGITRYALDADGGPPANFQRLTGVDLQKLEKFKDGFKNVQAVTLNLEAEGRLGLFLYSDAGTLLLINRGLGTFFLDESASGILTATGAMPLVPSATAPWTNANLHANGIDDLLVVNEDGTLYEMDNSPAK